MEDASLAPLNSFSKIEKAKSFVLKLQASITNPLEEMPYFLKIKRVNNDLRTQYDPVSFFKLPVPDLFKKKDKMLVLELEKVLFYFSKKQKPDKSCVKVKFFNIRHNELSLDYKGRSYQIYCCSAFPQGFFTNSCY